MQIYTGHTGHMPCLNLYWFCINVRLKNVLSYQMVNFYCILSHWLINPDIALHISNYYINNIF
jgi:hypothetical protein